MPSQENLLLFVAASVLLALTPGPNLLYLISRTLAQGRAAGLASRAGLRSVRRGRWRSAGCCPACSPALPRSSSSTTGDERRSSRRPSSTPDAQCRGVWRPAGGPRGLAGSRGVAGLDRCC
jgi:hypothetical protein